MTDYEYEQGDQPWGRKNAEATFCPFCGKKDVMLSYGDVNEDDVRVEFYCDNSLCDVREYTAIVLRTDRRLQRADVVALEEIDSGTAAEKLPDVINLMSPADSVLVFRHSAGILGRRRRNVSVEITPLVD